MSPLLARERKKDGGWDFGMSESANALSDRITKAAISSRSFNKEEGEEGHDSDLHPSSTPKKRRPRPPKSRTDASLSFFARSSSSDHYLWKVAKSRYQRERQGNGNLWANKPHMDMT